MSNNYFITEAAKIKQNQLIQKPESFDINNDYLKILSKEEIYTTFNMECAKMRGIYL